jgi:Ctr copper transporter family
MRQVRSTALMALLLVSLERSSSARAGATKPVDPSSTSSFLVLEEKTRKSDCKHAGVKESEVTVKEFPFRKLKSSDQSNGALHHGGQSVLGTEPLVEASISRSENHHDAKEMKRVRPEEGPQYYVAMHMTGLQFSAWYVSKEKGRLSYLGLIKVRSFASLVVAMLLSFGISFGLEYAAFRGRRQLHIQKSDQGMSHQQRQCVRTSQYAIISYLSQVAMLAAMTYSVEIMIALLAGHMTGHYLFNSHVMEQASSLKQTSTPSSAGEDGERDRQSELARGDFSLLQSICRNFIPKIRDPFALLVFPAARERIRRQAHPKREGGRIPKGNKHLHDELEESTTRDEEDVLPLLRKRDLKR